MIIQCPHCHARLNLPEHAEGMQVRCAICRQVFRAGQEAVKESVQAGSAESVWAPVMRKPRRLEDGDGVQFDFSPNSRELVENAKSLMRPAAYAMLGAFILSITRSVGYVGFVVAMGPEQVALTSFCHVFMYTPILVFIGIGARSLFTLGSRGLIVTAIVMNFIEALIISCALVCNIVLLGAPGIEDTIALAMNSPSSLANLVAAVMAIRVLTFREVADAYAARAEEQRRRRY